ncbi:MAG TPA: hypothetical protein VH702_18715 [Vicinamibacterales bacterium]|jgi:hypothetical protein
MKFGRAPTIWRIRDGSGTGRNQCNDHAVVTLRPIPRSRTARGRAFILPTWVFAGLDPTRQPRQKDLRQEDNFPHGDYLLPHVG